MNKAQKFIFCFFCLALIYFLFLSPPADFPLAATVRVQKGQSLHSISNSLKKEHIIRSKIVFETLVIFLGGEKRIISADYLFENKLPVFGVAERILGGRHHTAPVTVTIPEGFDTTQIGNTFASALNNFNESKFLAEAKSLEGYLFPDTYFFLTTSNEADVLQSMSVNFKKKIATLLSPISASGSSERDIIIMASIIEREAKGDTDRGFISEILWKRISLGIPLGVDAAPETYKVKGLPKNPVCNPGLEAIKAAIFPEHSLALYYLHDKNGTIHYAKTFAEHQANIAKYLK